MEPLRQDKLDEAIRRRRMVRRLIGPRARFLADYRVSNYVTPAQIYEVTLDGARSKAPAPIFFSDKAGLLMTIEGSQYDKPFDVVLFDTFVVIEVAPRTLQTQFLVLVPNFETKTGSYVLSDTLTNTSVLETVNAIKHSRGHAALLDEAGEVLASLDSS